jgi:WD40 repeat protein
VSADGRWRVDLDDEHAVWTGPVDGSSARRLHHETAIDASISDDGGRILLRSGGKAGSAALWDREAGCVLWEQERTHTAALSPDGTLVATVFAGRVRLREAASGDPLGDPLSHPVKVRAVAFSPDGALLATSCGDGSARVWSTLDGTLQAVLLHEDFLERPIGVNLVRFGADASRLLTTTGDDHRVSAWNVVTGRLLWDVDLGGGNPAVLEARQSSDGRWVACWGSSCGTTAVLDGFTGRLLEDATGGCPDALAFTDDGRFLLALEGAALTCRATGTWEERWRRVDFPGGAWLRAVPSLHCDGSRAGLEQAFVVRGADSTRLSELAFELLDPRKVEAALAGVAVEPARLP